MKPLDIDRIWNFIISECALTANFELHGERHWRNVERNGLGIAKAVGADETIVRLFAIFHDCKRINEDIDVGHGHRATEFIRSLAKSFLSLAKSDIEKLCYACSSHTDTIHSDDITIATCWDADRLDLPRVGKMPNVNCLNTEEAKKIAFEMFP